MSPKTVSPTTQHDYRMIFEYVAHQLMPVRFETTTPRTRDSYYSTVPRRLSGSEAVGVAKVVGLRAVN